MRKESNTVEVSESPIPPFPAFRPLGIRDREIIRELLLETPVGTSDFSFVNLFSWQKGFPIEISRLGNHLLLLERPFHAPPRFHPILGSGNIEETVEAIAEFLPRFAHIPTELVASYEIFQQKGFSLKPNPENMDYLYERQAISDLKGKHFEGKKELVRAFQTKHPYQFRPLTPEAFDACLHFSREWSFLHTPDLDGQITDFEWDAIRLTFDHHDRLKILGGICEIEGRVEGFVVGERLDEETGALLFVRGNPGLEGIFSVLWWESARKVFKDFQFINGGIDWGSQILRTELESWHPIQLLEKYYLERPL